MITVAHEAAVDGTKLSSIDDRIIVQGVTEDAGKDAYTTAAISGRSSQRVTNRRRDYIDVSVNFGILVHRSDMQTRGELLEAVAAWAAKARNGAWITVGHRAGRRLWARLYSLPAAGDMWDWTATYKIVFRAWEVPFWQDATPVSIRRSGSTLSQQISVNGSAQSVLNMTFQNTSGSSCDTLSISTGAAGMSFSSLGLASGESLVIDHTEDGTLRIRILSGSSYRSAMAKRNPSSDDDLWIDAGMPAISGSAGRSGVWTLTVYGRYEV